MFRDLIKTMNAINEQKISIPIETDGKGYVDKQCPAKDCEFIFKVNGDDWSNKFKDEKIWCPLCRHEAPADQWFTIDQIEHAKREAITILKGKVHNALISGAQKFNSRQPKKSFISMSLKVNCGYKRTYIIPARAAELMQFEIQCENCDARFAVIGSAYFCPCCGFNSVTRTFSDSLRKISAKKDNLV